jgi:recombination associated protein RdgC
MFRNVRYYQFEGQWPNTEEAVSEQLTKAKFRPCGPFAQRSSGWVPIDPNGSELLARRVNGADLVRLRSQSRVLPPAAINEALEERIEDFRVRMGEDPTPREKRRLKAETREDLLSKALLKSDRTWGFIDPVEKIIAIDAAQPTTCERFLSHFRQAFDVLNIKPLAFKEPIEALLTKVFLGDAPVRFNVGHECRMQDTSEARSSVRWSNFDLTDRTIRNHIGDGMHLTHLAIEYDNVLSCVIDQHGVLSKLKLLGADDKDTQADNDPLARQDAEFVLLTGTLRQLLGDLKKLLNGFGQE